MTIHNLSDEAHRILTIGAARHGRSAEAEMRVMLEAATWPEDRLRLGAALSGLSRIIGLSNADIETLEENRDTRPAKPLRLHTRP